MRFMSFPTFPPLNEVTAAAPKARFASSNGRSYIGTNRGALDVVLNGMKMWFT